jgi:hypothetical protein
MITEQIEKLLQDDERALAAAKKRLERCAEGRLRIRKTGKYIRLSRELPPQKGKPRKESYLSRKKDAKLITSLCSKRYYTELIQALAQEIQLLQSFLDGFDPQKKIHCIRVLPESLQGCVNLLCKSPEQLCKEWENEPFETNTYPFDQEPLRTKKGELVRNRAECLIANTLFDLHIPYRYECAVKLADGGTVYPDFTILHPETLEIFYLEFFGKMDDPSYAVSAFSRIRRYANSPIFPKLIMIFDHCDAPFNTDTLLNVLKNYFL